MVKTIDIDVSSAKKTLDELRRLYTEKQFQRIVYSALKRTGEQTRTAVKRIVQNKYVVKQNDVLKRIGKPNTQFGGAGLGVQCTIPIEGSRLTIGGGFRAKGGKPGWSNIASNGKGKRYKITAKIVKKETSKMPEVMKHQGGYPPFINTTAKKLNGVAFTRTGEKTKEGKDAIVKVVGIGIPQMPLNRSKAEIQDFVADKLIERLEHEHARRVKQCQR